MRGRTLLILDHGVKGQLWHSVYKTLWEWYRLQFLPNHFPTSHASCGWWEEETWWFWVTGLKVKVNFGTLSIKPRGHDKVCIFSPITFKRHMQAVNDERKNSIDFGSWGQKTTLALVYKPCGHDIDYSFCQITWNLLTMREGTLLILSHQVKSHGQLWDSACETLLARYRLQFLPEHLQLHVQTSYVSYWWWEERPYSFWVFGSNAVVTLSPPLCEGMPHFALSNSFLEMANPDVASLTRDRFPCV